MSKFSLLALEWDAREARVVLGRRRGKDAVVIEQAFAVDLRPADPSQTINVSERIASALAAHAVGKVDTLVAVGRANIELRSLTLPPVPDEELPDLTRFQAQRQFTSIGENWPLDFVPLESTPDAVTVLAAAISSDLVQQIRQTCEKAELIPKRLVLRPFAAASLWRRSDTSHRCSMMLDPLAEEADLTAIADGKVVFPRTVRLPTSDDPDEQARAMLGEIRRTMAAAHNQLHGKRIEQVVVCGGQHEHAKLKAAIEQQLSLPVVNFDPFDGLELGPDLQIHPDNAGRYAPLIGLLVDEAAGETHAIDFLHPRERPKPASQRRRQAMIGGGVGLVAATIAAVIGWQWWGLDGEIARLKRQSGELDKAIKLFDKPMKHVDLLNQFTAGDITWLDELRRASEKFPSADDAIVTQLSAGSAPSGPGGQLLLEGYVREASLVEELERALRDDKHGVSGQGSQEAPRQERYHWRFKETLDVAAEEPNS